MEMKRGSRNGFTLVELLIVVIILGILAAIVIPQLSTSSDEAKESTLVTDIQMMRNAIDLYRVQHKDLYPGTISGQPSWDNFVMHMTTATDADGNSGTDFGPYLRTGIPRNPVNDLDTGTEGTIPSAPDDSTGWYYDAATGEFRANSSGTGPSGIDYFDL